MIDVSELLPHSGDMMLLEELTKALEELDPDSRRICELIKKGFSDREMAAECKLPILSILTVAVNLIGEIFKSDS